MKRTEKITNLMTGHRVFVSVIVTADAPEPIVSSLRKKSIEWGEGLEIIVGNQNQSATETLKQANGFLCWFIKEELELFSASLSHLSKAFAASPEIQALFADALLLDSQARPVDYHHANGINPVLRLAAISKRDPLVVVTERLQIFLESRATLRSLPLGAHSLAAFVEDLAPGLIGHLPHPIATLPFAPSSQADIYAPSPLKAAPKVSIIIPNRNSFALISRVLEGLYEKTSYRAFEVVVVDNGTTERETLDLYEAYQKRYDTFSVSIKDEPFNFSRMVNRGLTRATGEHFLLLNNDIEVIAAHWLTAMVECLCYRGTGIVGAKLYFPDDTIQHAGVIIGLNGMASHWFYKEPGNSTGPNNRLSYPQSMSCVTGAAMLISRACYAAVGEWDEHNFAIAYNDVDYCLRARALGFQSVWTPHAELYHHESASRGKMKSWKDWWRFQKEKAALKRCHKTHLFEDPAFSPRFVKKPGRLKLKMRLKTFKPRQWSLKPR